MSDGKNAAIVLGFPNYREPAERMADKAGIAYADIHIHRFPDGESLVRLPDALPKRTIFYSSLDDANRQLIELASRLDAYDVIDMKVCEKTMSIRGVNRQDIPSFIESVPYAPSEIKQRLQDGYINL